MYIIMLAFTLNIVLWIRPLTVYANGPKPANSLIFDVTNYPDEAVYVDLLIKMDESNEHYLAFNESMGKEYGITKESEIVSYEKNGYVSYAFHFANASCDIELEKDKYNSFATNRDDFNYIYNKCRYFKVAVLDRNGAILTISKEYRLKGITDGYLSGVMTYDAAKNQVEGITHHTNPLTILPIMFLSFLCAYIAPLLITVAIESLVARIFKFDFIQRIVYLNIVTNIALSIYITIIQSFDVTYTTAVITGEILVYVTEFLWIYKNYHKNISGKRIAQYTIVANTLSLIATVLFNLDAMHTIERL